MIGRISGLLHGFLEVGGGGEADDAAGRDLDFLTRVRVAADAGGVGPWGLEMTRNSMRITWPPEEVDAKLRSIMQNIHSVCVQYGTQADGYINYVNGANIGGFMKVANAMLAQGCV